VDTSLKSKILKLRKEGKTYKEIKYILGCSKGTISFHCRKAGLSDFNKFKSPTKDVINEMQRYYNECNSSVKVAEKFGFSKKTVLKYIKTSKRKKRSNKECKASAVKAVINYRKRVKQKLVDYKGGKCQICGYNRCIKALEFHHCNPLEKDFTISGKTWKFETLKKEVDKCILVCSNCHKEIHDGLIKI
jgi:DNA-binding CsgD family transcriptional regulator